MSGLVYQDIPSDLDTGWGSTGKVGLVVLATDQTLEVDMQRILAPCGIGVFGARVAMDTDVTPETLAAMRTRLADASATILPGVQLDVIGFGCTSASAVMGEDVVFRELQPAHPTAQPTTPMTAAGY